MKELNDVRKAILNFAGWEQLNEHTWYNHEKRLRLQIVDVFEIKRKEPEKRYKEVTLEARADRFAPWRTIDERKCKKNCKKILHEWLFEIL